MTQDSQQPSAKWDSKSRKFEVSLPTPDGVFDASWISTPSFVVRIQEKGSDEWSPGFETPFNSCTFTGLKPNTAYILEVRAKNDAGESEPAYIELRTLPDGTLSGGGPVPNWPLLE